MKTIFWNVDTQKDFMNADGALYVPDAEEIKPNLATITSLAEEYKVQTVNTADWHNEDSEELSDNPDFINTFPPHCLAGTKGAEFVIETEPLLHETYYWDKEPENLDKLERRNVVIYKDKFDVFAGNPYTDEILKAINPDRVFVYGVATNVCVDYAVRGLLKRNKEVYVVNDAIKALPGIPSPEESWYEAGAKKTITKDLEALL